jgi:hypothetical protein
LLNRVGLDDKLLRKVVEPPMQRQLHRALVYLLCAIEKPSRYQAGNVISADLDGDTAKAASPAIPQPSHTDRPRSFAELFRRL